MANGGLPSGATRYSPVFIRLSPAWWLSRGAKNPIPSRTRPLNSPAPMVLSLKAWKSRSLPGLPRTDNLFNDDCASITCIAAARDGGRFVCGAALRRHEAAAVIPRRLFYAPNHSIEAQCLHTRHSGTERSEEPGIHTSDDS